MSTDTLRIGFIGAGGICRSRHLPGLAALNGVEVVVVCNRSTESSERVAGDFGIPEVDTDWQRVIARDDLDIIFIGTWPYMHRELSIAALEAGKHCFCQARMCMNVAEAKEMLAVARAHPDLVNMICPVPFQLEQYIRDLVRSDMGQITSVELSVVSGANLDRSSVHWRERTDYSGYQIMSMGIFAEMMNGLVGPYERLTAHLSTPIAEKTDESGQPVAIDVPQVVAISGTLASGALIIEHHSGLSVDSSGRSSLITVRGTEGTFRYDFQQTLEWARPGEALQSVDVPDEKRTVWSVESDFIAAVRAARNGAPPEARPVRPDFEEGLLYMRKVEAVHLSASTGEAVAPHTL